MNYNPDYNALCRVAKGKYSYPRGSTSLHRISVALVLFPARLIRRACKLAQPRPSQSL